MEVLFRNISSGDNVKNCFFMKVTDVSLLDCSLIPTQETVLYVIFYKPFALK